jgi:hypothetical protein
MSTNASPLIEILDSLAWDWEYAPLLRNRLESGDISSEQIAELTAILWGGMQKIENENSRLEIENILFRKFLIQTEEADTRKSENESIDILLASL